MTTTSQERFDQHYITSSEIQSVLSISRSSIMYARKCGRLPGAIHVKLAGTGAYIWERGPIQRHIDAWALSLTVRRRNRSSLSATARD